MRKSIIKKGDKYNRLTAIKFSHMNCSQCWFFRCDCGNEKVILVNSVKNGKSKSCGCLNKEITTKHGMTKTKTYISWQAMKQRCSNKNCSDYKDYGGRGIKVCSEWLNNFKNFYDDMGNGSEGKSLDRINNNLGYCKENCRWADIFQQANNKRNNRFLTYKRKTQTIKQWSKELGINYSILYKRIKNGWSTKRALDK